MLKTYFKISWRTIKKNKFFSFINVIGLSLGICSCLVIYLVSSFEHSFDTFHPDIERIYRVTCQFDSHHNESAEIPAPMPSALRQEISGLEAVSCSYVYFPKITIQDKNKKPRSFDSNVEGTDGGTNTIFTDKNYFSIFKYDWLVGDPTTSLINPFKVVLSESRACKYFGAISVAEMIGREVVYDDSIRVSVSGIVKDWNNNTDFPFTDFISFSTINNSGLKNYYHNEDWRPIKGNHWVWSFVKLSDKVTPRQIDNQLKLFLEHHLKDIQMDSIRFVLQPLTNIHFEDYYSGDNIRKANLPSLRGLMAIALFVLIIAAINFINLSTAQSLQRAKEIGVRKVLGSSRRSLIFQFLVETFLLTIFAVCLALVIVKPVLIAFRDFIPFGVAFNLFNPSTLLFILIVTLFTSLLGGLYPAKVLSSYLPRLSLKGGGGGLKGGGKWWLRKGLIVFQFTISLIFIVGAIVISNQVRFMLNSDFGLKTDAVILVNMGWINNDAKLSVLEEKIKQLPAVNQVVRQGNAPMGWIHGGINIKYKARNELEMNVSMDCGNEDYIPFYRIRLLAGRNLQQSDSLKEFVINETFTRALGFKKPEEAVGKLLYQDTENGGQKAYPIVGVVADFHEGSFHEAIRPVVIGHVPESEKSLGIKLVSTGKNVSNVKVTLANMEKIWKDLYPNEPFSYHFMEDSIASFYEKEEKTSNLIGASTIVAIFISCMGLFGLAIFTAKRKTKEIGIRKVLGASVRSIVTMLSKDFVKLVIISILIASPLAWWLMNKWLQDFAYRINISWWMFVLAGIGAILIALTTVSFQTVKAALTNPAKSLRSE
jgi:putative ABC transport system permease protein